MEILLFASNYSVALGEDENRASSSLHRLATIKVAFSVISSKSASRQALTRTLPTARSSDTRDATHSCAGSTPARTALATMSLSLRRGRQQGHNIIPATAAVFRNSDIACLDRFPHRCMPAVEDRIHLFAAWSSRAHQAQRGQGLHKPNRP